MTQTEDQQVEQLKQWWKDNGMSIIVGAVLAVAGVSGWKYYQDAQVNKAKEASSIYYELLEAAEDEDKAAAMNLAEQLSAQYDDTTYGALGLLMQAKLSVEAGELEQAAAFLETATQNDNDVIAAEARLRLFDVMDAQGKTEAAIAVLDAKLPAAFEAAAQERKGDAYVKLGKTEEAKTAYDAALASAQLHDYNTQVLQQKRDNLG